MNLLNRQGRLAQDTEVLHCPRCNRPFCIPREHARLSVTCPECQFNWKRAVTGVQTLVTQQTLARQLLFRCAKTGAKFYAFFDRHDSSQRFRITKLLTDHSINTAPALRRNARAREIFSVRKFDFVGWFCPCCGHGKQSYVDMAFVRCGKCGECVCGATIKQIQNGARTFVCHPGCGGSGVISGEIAEYDAAKRQIVDRTPHSAERLLRESSTKHGRITNPPERQLPR
jgi:hypothetical protein